MKINKTDKILPLNLSLVTHSPQNTEELGLFSDTDKHIGFWGVFSTLNGGPL